MHYKKFVTVIMAAYNSDAYIAKAIQSILNQSFVDFELIIINDASTDNTLKIIRQFLRKDERMILINNRKNLGQTRSRNKALKIASGKYIAIMDSDDISWPKRLGIQYEYLEANTEVFLLGGGVVQIDDLGKVGIRPKLFINPSKLCEILPKRNVIYHSSIMFRNEGNYFYRSKFKFTEDYDFYLMMLSDHKILHNIPDIIISYRISSSGIGRKRKIQETLFSQKAREFYIQRLKFGFDEYEKFNPDEICLISIENTKDKLVLKAEILAAFKANDFLRVRFVCKKYFKNFGFFNKMILYYFLSFWDLRAINFLRKIIF